MSKKELSNVVPASVGMCEVSPKMEKQGSFLFLVFGVTCSRTGVANLFGKWAKFKKKKVQRANIWFKGFLAGQVLALL